MTKQNWEQYALALEEHVLHHTAKSKHRFHKAWFTRNKKYFGCEETGNLCPVCHEEMLEPDTDVSYQSYGSVPYWYCAKCKKNMVKFEYHIMTD